MDKLIKITCLVILLAGCNPFRHPEVEKVIVKVPVMECPASYTDQEKPVRPMLVSPLLTPSDAIQPGKVAQACAVDARRLMNYAEQLEDRVEMADTMCAKP